jgi:hypothetical protein
MIPSKGNSASTMEIISRTRYSNCLTMYKHVGIKEHDFRRGFVSILRMLIVIARELVYISWEVVRITRGLFSMARELFSIARERNGI